MVENSNLVKKTDENDFDGGKLESGTNLWDE